MHANISLLRFQRPMLNMVGSIFLNAFKKQKEDIKGHLLRSEVNNIIPESEIVESYHRWLNCEKRYSSTIAPHLFPLWTYPQLYQLGKSLHLPLHKVLNQGCKMIINDELPKNSGLNCKAEIFQIQNMEKKYRLSQRLTTGSHQNPEALIAEIYAVVLKDTKSVLKKKQSFQPIDTSDLTHLRQLYISREDAKSYAYLSGDVNPIHLSKHIAKLMGLRGSIMHGFGLFAMVYEALREEAFNITEIDVRFIKPVYLDHQVDLYLGRAKKNSYSVKLISRDKKFLHMAGEIKYKDLTCS